MPKIEMHKVLDDKELTYFVGCWLLWIVLFVADALGLLEFLPTLLFLPVGVLLLFLTGLTAFSGHELGKKLIANANSNASKTFWLFGSVLTPLTLLLVVSLMFSDASLVDVANYIKGNPWADFTTLEYVLACNTFIGISFLFLNKTSSLLSWANGNFLLFFLMSFWPMGDGPHGYLCNGQFVSLDYAFGGCNGLEYNYRDMISYKTFLKTQWGLDSVAKRLADFIQFSLPASLGLLILGIIHVLWRKPYSIQ